MEVIEKHVKTFAVNISEQCREDVAELIFVIVVQVK